MADYLGDFAEDATVYIPFNTFSSDDPQASVTITNLVAADIKVHKDGSLTQIVTDGATVAIDFDSITGNHLITIDTSVDAAYSTGSDYIVRIEGTTVDAGTVNAFIGSFSIENRFMRGTDSAATEAKQDIINNNVDTLITRIVGTLAAGTHNPQTGDSFARLATYRLGELMSAVLASQPFSGSLMGDLTQDNADDAGTQQFSVAALMRLLDEVNTGARHNISQSIGKQIRQSAATIFNDGTLQTGGAIGTNTAQLASGAVTFNDQFARTKFIVIGGLGVGQEFIVTGSVASTDTITFTPAIAATIDNTSEYEILPAQTHSTVRNGGYDNNSVYYDSGSKGSAGTQPGVNGTTTNPVDNFADLMTILTQENLAKVDVAPGSLLTLAADFTELRVFGTSYDVALGNQDINATGFTGGNISGIGTAGAGDPPSFFLCGMGNVTLPPCNGFECGFFGTFTMGSAGNFTFGGSADVFGLGLIVDYGAGLNASGFTLQSWGGGAVEIQNAGAGTGTYKFEINALGGGLTINANCSATTEVDMFGSMAPLVNNASGITVNDNTTSTGVALAAQNDFDPTSDAVANVTLVATTTTNTDMITFNAIWTTQLTESYAADGTAPTPAQMGFITMQNLQSFSFAGTTQTVRRINDSTTAATYTLDDATNPTSKERTT